MTAKQYLRQLKRLDQTINAKIDQLTELRSLSEKITGVTKQDPVQISSDHDKTSSIIAKIVDLEREINSTVDDLINLKTEIIELINSVSVEDYRLLLTKRYVNCDTWEQIAVDMGYSFRWVCGGLHSRALQEFEKSYQKKDLVHSNSYNKYDMV